MSNLKSLNSRIKSVKSTQKMTKAMRMVAASKLRRARQMAEMSRPYAHKIAELMHSLASNIATGEEEERQFPLLTGHPEQKTHLLVILSSDRGLCGGLNSTIVRFAKNHINSLISSGKQIKILCVGKKAYDQLKGQFEGYIIDHIAGIFKENINYQKAKEVSDKVITLFNKKEFDSCEIIYNHFKSAIAQEIVKKQLIPIRLRSKHETLSAIPLSCEPNKEEILEALLPRNLTMQFYNALLESSASEQGARMAAMEAATKNAGEMIRGLTLIYNRTRQANITKELIDIISGANSV